MLPEAVGASVFPEQVVAPLRQIVRGARFVMGSDAAALRRLIVEMYGQ